MNIDFSSLGTLASAVEQAGAPILGAALRAGSTVSSAAPFPLNLVLPVALNSLASAVGGDAANPASVADRINADPNAVAAKIQAVEALHRDNLKNALEMAKLQTDQIGSYLTADIPVWVKFYFGGWRPTMGWVGSVVVIYQALGVMLAWPLVPGDMFNVILATWTSLAGLRTVEKWKGAASPLPVVRAQSTRMASRAAH